jgi:hypothetical protein
MRKLLARWLYFCAVGRYCRQAERNRIESRSESQVFKEKEEKQAWP